MYKSNDMKLSQFKFRLPEEQIAQFPLAYRDDSRLLVLHSKTGEIEHKMVTELVNYFEEGDSIPIIYNYQETTELRMFLKDRKLQRVWTPKTSGTMYPLNQIPADRKRLPGFMWYDGVRPLNRDDIFHWRSKHE